MSLTTYEMLKRHALKNNEVYENENSEIMLFWDSLNKDEKEKAFRAVTSLIFENVVCGDDDQTNFVKKNGFNKYYDTGYYVIHELINDGKKYIAMEDAEFHEIN